MGVLAAHKNQILIRRILDISLDGVINSSSSSSSRPTLLEYTNYVNVRCGHDREGVVNGFSNR